MKEPMISFLLVLLIEGICAIAAHLKNRLMRHMQQRDCERSQDRDFEYDYGPDYT